VLFDWIFASGKQELVVLLNEFYSDAAASKLPDFSFIEPSCCGQSTTSMHPTGLISDGENLIRDVFSALRAYLTKRAVLKTTSRQLQRRDWIALFTPRLLRMVGMIRFL
jgi:hypothetical protein